MTASGGKFGEWNGWRPLGCLELTRLGASVWNSVVWRYHLRLWAGLKFIFLRLKNMYQEKPGQKFGMSLISNASSKNTTSDSSKWNIARRLCGGGNDW